MLWQDCGLLFSFIWTYWLIGLFLPTTVFDFYIYTSLFIHLLLLVLHTFTHNLTHSLHLCVQYLVHLTICYNIAHRYQSLLVI